MSPLLRKETRLLVPGWVAAVVSALFSLMMPNFLDGVWVFFVSVSALILVTSPCGKEAAYGTFGLLLVQPAKRVRLWRIKTSLLAAALVSVWVILILCASAVIPHGAWMDFVAISGCGVLVVFSGGLWTTLLLRDVLPAIFCTCLAPGFVVWMTIAAMGHWLTPEDDAFAIIIYLVLIAYSVAGFIWARRLFLRAEDVGWTGGQLSLKSLRWLAFECKAGQSKWTSLIKKELQLQEVTMVLVPLLALLHFALVAVSHFNPKWLSVDRELLVNVIPFIWLVSVPMVVGCVAVAEERRLNTFESLLCLPVSKRASFTIKLVVSLVLGVILGGVLPGLLLRLTGGHHDTSFEENVAFALVIPAIVTGASFYAASMSRGLLQALPVLLGCIGVPAFALGLMARWIVVNNIQSLQFMRSSLVPGLAWPTVIITLLVLSFSNYKRLLTGWSLWFENLFKTGATFTCVALVGTGIYTRVWEYFMPLEPKHGPARISGPGHATLGTWLSGTIKETKNGRTVLDYSKTSALGLYALLPDGRLWIGKASRPLIQIESNMFGPGPYTNISGEFITGSNWVQVAGSRLSLRYGLRSDGTLWRIGETNVNQVGLETDWKQIVGGTEWLLGVKRDGTLWRWDGMPEFETPRFHHPDPIQIGHDSDWASVFNLQGAQPIAVKRDGTWQYGDTGRISGTTFNTSYGTFNWNMDGTNWMALATFGNFAVGIQKDGSLWATGYFPPSIFGEKVQPGVHKDVERIGTKSDWIALSGYWELAALDAKGTIWTMEQGETKRPSKYSDWLAVSEDNFTWALAKDGTLSCWNEFGVNDWTYRDSNNPTFLQKFFLGPTRRPLVSVNIFDSR